MLRSSSCSRADHGDILPTRQQAGRELGKARRWPLAAAFGVAYVTAQVPGAASSRQLALQDLCVTLGTLSPRTNQRLSVAAPKMRAVARVPTPSTAELRFTYLGPSKQSAALASGELRHQLGLKLRAADSCNLLYVMWRFEPRSQLVVSIKHNLGRHTHAECGTSGYRNVKPSQMVTVPELRQGQAHALDAALEGQFLRVRVDGKEVWTGDVGPEVRAFDGPIGVRSDNVEVIFQLNANVPDLAGHPVAACPNGPVEEE